MKLILAAALATLCACPSLGERITRLDEMDEATFVTYQDRVERRTATLARAVLEEGDVTAEKLAEIAGIVRAGLLASVADNVEGYKRIAVDLALDILQQRLGGDIVSPRARALLDAVADALEDVAEGEA